MTNTRPAVCERYRNWHTSGRYRTRFQTILSSRSIANSPYGRIRERAWLEYLRSGRRESRGSHSLHKSTKPGHHVHDPIADSDLGLKSDLNTLRPNENGPQRSLKSLRAHPFRLKQLRQFVFIPTLRRELRSPCGTHASATHWRHRCR